MTKIKNALKELFNFKGATQVQTIIKLTAIIALAMFVICLFAPAIKLILHIAQTILSLAILTILITVAYNVIKRLMSKK